MIWLGNELPERADAALDRKELGRALDDALMVLSPRWRRMVVERFFDDRDLGYAAKRMGVTREKARQWHAKALRRVRERRGAWLMAQVRP